MQHSKELFRSKTVMSVKLILSSSSLNYSRVDINIELAWCFGNVNYFRFSECLKSVKLLLDFFFCGNWALKPPVIKNLLQSEALLRIFQVHVLEEIFEVIRDPVPIMPELLIKALRKLLKP